MVVKLGDIHGRVKNGFERLKTKILEFDPGTKFIQVGDLGIGFIPKSEELAFLADFNTWLGEHGFTFYAIRGNHDMPDWWNGSVMYTNLRLQPDYSTEIIEDKKYLFVGGAISVDRKINTLDVDYWLNEGFVLDENKLSQITDVDVVITHNAPKGVFPLVPGPLVHQYMSPNKRMLEEYKDNAKMAKRYTGDLSLLTDINKEREAMAKMIDHLRESSPNLFEWYYGHYHNSYTSYYQGIKFILLNEFELY